MSDMELGIRLLTVIPVILTAGLSFMHWQTTMGLEEILGRGGKRGGFGTGLPPPHPELPPVPDSHSYREYIAPKPPAPKGTHGSGPR